MQIRSNHEWFHGAEAENKYKLYQRHYFRFALICLTKY